MKQILFALNFASNSFIAKIEEQALIPVLASISAIKAESFSKPNHPDDVPFQQID